MNPSVVGVTTDLPDTNSPAIPRAGVLPVTRWADRVGVFDHWPKGRRVEALSPRLSEVPYLSSSQGQTELGNH